MTRMEDTFASLLTEGVHRIRLRESKTIQIVQDELGYFLGREGGSSIEYWRKGHIPPSLTDVEKLGREIVRRGDLDRAWLEKFLISADHPYPQHICDDVFGPYPSHGSNHNGVLPDDFNPFIVGPPICQSRYFFGRSYEIRRIFKLWRRRPLQNVAIIGHKRSGKTSLLHYLRTITTVDPSLLRPDQRTDWLSRPEQYRWVFVDFQDARMCRRERLLSYLLAGLELPTGDQNTLESFMDIVSLNLKTPTIIMMDEIGAALTSPELDLQFWGSLRSLVSNSTGGNLAFLLTAHESPALLAYQEGKPSPFFNIFGHTFKLGPFTEDEARSLIAGSPRPFDEADIQWILNQSGCWPYLLQILCHARLSALEDGETDDTWQREGMRQMSPYWYLFE
ncbi:MAG: ATP-binding protein [Anaerolineae bacterium]|nr:ATP-binding protein [Anaerolineae bacterium]